MQAADSRLRKIKNNDGRSERARAYIQIQGKIASGELQSGSAVSELSLAKQLGMSRTPIREAMGQLAAEGLLEQIPNRGAIVVQPTRLDIIDLYDLREALEVHAVGKAAQIRVNTSDLEMSRRLADSVLSLKEELERSGNFALNAEQMHRFIRSDLAFHTLLVRMASNRRILKIVNETRLLIQIFAMHREGHKIADLEQIHHYHCEIVRSVEERDRERAMRTLSEHIQASLRERLTQYDQWERESSLRKSAIPFFDDYLASLVQQENQP
jgi:DNA-binding GntR family transcriptional regulator